MRTALFWIFSIAAVASALGVVGSLRSPINSALSLVVSMLALPGCTCCSRRSSWG
jgi:NADH:ubiquinone oxidoreductase subunit 6 (subunit J)